MDLSADSRVADYAQLQREYRNMELNRKAYADESHQVREKPEHRPSSSTDAARARVETTD